MRPIAKARRQCRPVAAWEAWATWATRITPASSLAQNGAILLDAYRSMVEAIDEGRALTPAAEWLVDNYHLVEKQIREIRSDLPAGYYRELPKLAAGPLAGYPRVFGTAWAFVAHTDSRFDFQILRRYVQSGIVTGNRG